MNFFFWGVKGFKGIAGDLALGVQTQQLWAFQPLQNSQHLNLGITNLVDKASNPLNYISPCKNNIIFKKSSKRNQNPPSTYHNSITNLKFQHKPKYRLLKILR